MGCHQAGREHSIKPHFLLLVVLFFLLFLSFFICQDQWSCCHQAGLEDSIKPLSVVGGLIGTEGALTDDL